MESQSSEPIFYEEDDNGMPIAQPLAATNMPWRRLLRWATILILIVIFSSLAWQWKVTSAASANASEAVIYLATTQGIIALRKDGSQQWQVTADGTLLAVKRQMIVVKGIAATLAINADDGKITWLSAASGVGEALLTADGIIYSGPTDQQITSRAGAVFNAQAAATGVHLWTVALPTGNSATVAAMTSRVYVGLVNPRQSVASQSLTAYDIYSGAVIWHTQLPNTWYVFPQVQDGQLFAMTRNAYYALDATTGQIIWRVPADITATPVINGNSVYLATGSTLTAYDRATGVMRWRATLASDTLTNLAVTAEQVIAQSARTFTVLDTHGTVLWQSEGQPQMAGPFLIIGDMIYIQDASGISAYRLANGLWRWHFATTQPMGAMLLSSGNTLFAGRGATLFSLNRQTGQAQWQYHGTAPIWDALLATA